MTTDDRFELTLREVLASRDPGPPPERLTRRLAKARATGLERRTFSLVPVLRVAAASCVLAVVVALVLTFRQAPGPIGPGSLAPVGTPVPGVGLATPAPPVVPVALVGTLLVLGLALLRRVPSGLHRGVVAAGTLSLAFAYATAGSTIALRPIGFGVEGSTPVPAGDGSGDQYPLHLRPGQPFRFLVIVYNGSPETVTILGLDAAAADPQASVPRLVGLGLGPDPAGATFEGAIPFQETTLPPGGHASLIVLGDSGPCATGSTTQTTFALDEVPLVTRVAGWEATTAIQLGDQIAVAMDGDCLGSQP